MNKWQRLVIAGGALALTVVAMEANATNTPNWSFFGIGAITVVIVTAAGYLLLNRR